MIPFERPSIDKTQMDTARLWALRSTCSRAHVGAAISRGGRTIGTGFNGAPAGMSHCDHTTAYVPQTQDLSTVLTRVSPARLIQGSGMCRVAIHAETNAIAYAARHGVAVEGAELFVTMSPCYSCAQLIIAAGLIRVVYDRAYRDPSGISLLTEAGVTVEKYQE